MKLVRSKALYLKNHCQLPVVRLFIRPQKIKSITKMLKSNFMLSYPAASFQTEQPKFIFETEIRPVQIRKLEGLV